jgi:hypothetical protein
VYSQKGITYTLLLVGTLVGTCEQILYQYMEEKTIKLSNIKHAASLFI